MLTPVKRTQLSMALRTEADDMTLKVNQHLRFHLLKADRLRVKTHRNWWHNMLLGIENRITAVRYLTRADSTLPPESCKYCDWRDPDPEEPYTCLATPSGMVASFANMYIVPECCPLWGDITKHNWWINSEGQRPWDIKED